MALTVTDVDLIQRALESRLGDVYTALPGRVESYDPKTQCADVLPLVKRPLPTADGDIVSEDLPIVPNVPICFPRGGAFTISWPIAPGDSVLLIVTTYAIGGWRASGKSSEAGDVRLHSLGSSVAIPVLAPNSGALPEAQAADNAFIIVGPMLKLGTADASDFAALASKCDSNYQKVKDLFSGWNPVPNDGGAALKAASASLSFDPVGCSRVKIK